MLYDYPEYYEVAFSFRDIKAEADFMNLCIGRYSHVPVRDVLEVACGPAFHAEELIKKGYHYTGLDINRTMLDYAEYKWRHLRPHCGFVRADMVRFEAEKPHDFAFVMLGSLYLNSFEEIDSHFASMARTLRPGALYFLDCCIQFTDPLAWANNNAVVIEKDGVTVQSKFAIRSVDVRRQMYEEVWSVDVDDNGHRRSFQMVERNRAIFPDEFRSFIVRRKDFEFVGWWADWNLDHPITDFKQTNRPVVVIRRVGAAV